MNMFESGGDCGTSLPAALSQRPANPYYPSLLPAGVEGPPEPTSSWRPFGLLDFVLHAPLRTQVV